ncbi:MerR family transcriptional regulator [Dactylosporangium siamense]|uniref:MerR family transcriptional regulator n=1 Tax=Dactylosporangium siamense TaxID=685454 RepID=A0A919PXE1_9ACTN|nr:MerR family transcriptional regulator [Dactylosporangium siamense]GIG50120.1 MerR family transcriptional regulator [Dactylosporangium siamense]
MPYSPRETVQKTGFSLDTLRYYERIGLLDGIDRTAGGQRLFTDDDLDWLGVLRCLRDTGMPIARMRRYAELARDGDSTFEERAELLEEHDRDIERKIAELRDEQLRIKEKIGWYRRELARPELAHAEPVDAPAA